MTNEVDSGGERARIRESFDKLADDGLRLLRFNIIIIGLYVSAAGLLLQGASTETQIRFISSPWLWGGAGLMTLALGFSVMVYEPSRTVSIAPIFETREDAVYSRINYRTIVWSLRTAIAVMLGGAASLAVGLLDAFLPVGVSLLTVVSVGLLFLFLLAVPRFVVASILKIQTITQRARSALGGLVER